MKKGDKVNVCMSRCDCFTKDIQDSPIIRDCTIKYMPDLDGGTYCFLTEEGIEFVVNTSSRDFIGVEEVVAPCIDPNDIYHRDER